jgi:hypothetical protein
VVVNPCTHHPIFLGSRLGADVLDLDGHVLSTTQLLALPDIPHNENSSCGGAPCPAFDICKCAGAMSDCGGQACTRLTARTRAATRVTMEAGGPECTLYVAFDSSATASDGETYMKSRLRAFDITGDKELAPEEIPLNLQPQGTDVDSSPDSDPHNDFGAVVVADFFTPAVGLFFYEQDGGNPCMTSFRGIVSSDGTSFEALPSPVSGTFPTIFFSMTGGLADYLGAVSFTEPGRLFVTWSESIPTAAPCQACQGQDYSLAVMGAEVRP